MAGITLAQAETQLAKWLAADTAVASGQSYSYDGRTLTRADSKQIRENIEYWDKKVRTLSASTSRTGPIIRGATPV
jgi:hypothetical protein